MLSKHDLILGKLAISKGLITKNQLKQCASIQEKRKKPLGIILLEEDYIGEEALVKLVKAFQKYIREGDNKGKGEDLVLCRILLREKKLTVEEFLQFLMEQRSQTLDNPLSLAEVILNKDILSIKEFLEICDVMPNETFACPGCEKDFRLLSISPGKKLRCKHCKTIFHVPTIEEEITKFVHDKDSVQIPEEKEIFFPGYDILEEIAEGGMGIIYKVQKKSTGQIMALKVLREAQRSSGEAKERFVREAKTLAKLKHPKIVSVIDVEIDNETPYFTMDYVDGQPLSEIIENGAIEIEEATKIMVKICRGLQYAHDTGVIHRDIKPSNILIDSQGEPRITDFGLAKCVESLTLVTRSGSLLGTPYYMSPEQARGQLGRVGPRSDIYSLGVVFYEMLTGQNPFKGENTVEIYHHILSVDPPPPSDVNPDVPASIDNICLKCLKKEPFHRYKTSNLLAEDLLKYKEKDKKGIFSKVFGIFKNKK